MRLQHYTHHSEYAGHMSKRPCRMRVSVRYGVLSLGWALMRMTIARHREAQQASGIPDALMMNLIRFTNH